MGDFNRNLLDPYLQTDLFVNEMFVNGLFPLIDKHTRIFIIPPPFLITFGPITIRVQVKALSLLIQSPMILPYINAPASYLHLAHFKC